MSRRLWLSVIGRFASYLLPVIRYQSFVAGYLLLTDNFSLRLRRRRRRRRG
jgi:hypothetical protein